MDCIQLIRLYEHSMKKSNVFEWSRQFKEEQENMYNDTMWVAHNTMWIGCKLWFVQMED